MLRGRCVALDLRDRRRMRRSERVCACLVGVEERKPYRTVELFCGRLLGIGQRLLCRRKVGNTEKHATKGKV